MSRYVVAFSENAEADLASSVQWGLETWGEEATFQWYREFKHSITDLLSTFPLSQPPAPDNDEFDVEVQQMVVGRYRVLFTIQDKRVVILHIRGPFVSG
jgi:plasmid stabilization system protein ParE